MKPRRYLTPAEKRVLSTMRTHGNAVRVWNSGDYSWWVADRPVTRVVHSLAVKGHLRIEGDEAHPTASPVYATEAGTSKSTILRAIQSGRLSVARTDDGGGYAIDPAELFRVYSPKSSDNDADQGAERPTGQDASSDEPLQNAELRIRNAQLEADLKALRAILELERERIQDRDRRLEEIKAERLAWQEQAARLALAGPRPPEHPPESFDDAPAGVAPARFGAAPGVERRAGTISRHRPEPQAFLLAVLLAVPNPVDAPDGVTFPNVN